MKFLRYFKECHDSISQHDLMISLNIISIVPLFHWCKVTLLLVRAFVLPFVHLLFLHSLGSGLFQVFIVWCRSFVLSSIRPSALPLMSFRLHVMPSPSRRVIVLPVQLPLHQQPKHLPLRSLRPIVVLDILEADDNLIRFLLASFTRTAAENSSYARSLAAATSSRSWASKTASWHAN